MTSSVEELCETLASAFADGRIEGVWQYYTYPLIIFTPGGIRIEIRPEETAEAIFARRALALRAGMRSVRVTIASIEERPRGRIPVELAWDFVDARGRSVGRSAMRYFCRRDTAGTLRIEMIEFSQLAFSDTIEVPRASDRSN